MPRPRYPSDEARKKQRPHVKVHMTTRTHRKTAGHFDSAEFRGQFLALLMVAYDAYAGRSGGRLHLGPADIAWISGKRRADVARKSVEHLLNVLELPIEHRGDVIVTTIPKFLKKQYMHSALRTESTRTPPASEYRVPSTHSNSEEEQEEEAADAALWFEPYRPFLRMLKPTVPSNERWLREQVAPLNDRIRPKPGEPEHAREFKAAMFAEYQTPRWNGKSRLSQKQRAEDEERRQRHEEPVEEEPLESWQEDWIHGRA